MWETSRVYLPLYCQKEDDAEHAPGVQTIRQCWTCLLLGVCSCWEQERKWKRVGIPSDLGPNTGCYQSHSTILEMETSLNRSQTTGEVFHRLIFCRAVLYCYPDSSQKIVTVQITFLSGMTVFELQPGTRQAFVLILAAEMRERKT